MGLLRLILLVVIAVLIYRMLRNWQARRAARGAKPADQGKMLACDHCGLYFPEQDAVREGARVFCSEAHRLAQHQDQA